MKTKSTTIPKILVLAMVMSIGLISLGTIEVRADIVPPTSGDYTVLAPLPCIEGGGITCTTGGNGAVQPTVNFKTYVQYTINLLIGLSAVVAVVMIVWGGAEYMFNASFYGKKMGLEKVTHAIYGLVLVLTSYIILRTIDPRLVEIPNTIVPTIVMREVLMEDASALLMNKVADDESRTRVRGIEIGKEIEAARAEVLEHKQTLAVIDEELSTVDKSTPEGKLRSETLETQQKKTAEALRSAEVERAIASAKQSFNGQISSTLGDLSGDATSGETVQSKIKFLRTNIDNIEKLRLEKIKQLQNLGEIDMSPINNEAKYAKTAVNIYILELMATTATIKYTSSGSGMGGAGYKTSYVISTPDGKDREFNSKSDIVNYLQSEITQIEFIKNNLTNNQHKTDLQQRIENLQNVIKNNKTLN
jgi:hypothetical protein